MDRLFLSRKQKSLGRKKAQKGCIGFERICKSIFCFVGDGCVKFTKFVVLASPPELDTYMDIFLVGGCGKFTKLIVLTIPLE